MQPAVDPASVPAPWAHLPAETQKAIQIAIAEAFAAWLDDEVAARKRRIPTSQMGSAGSQVPGASTTPL